MKRLFLGITGASGAVYGVRLLEALVASGQREVHLCITPDGMTNINLELGTNISTAEELLELRFLDGVTCYDPKDFAAAVSSGSFMVEDYVIAPASMGFVGRAAGGISSNLVERCADVALKEYRNLVILFREMPLSQIHLENLLTLTRAGAKVLPAAPGFYHNPESIEELVDFVVGKIFDILKIEHTLFHRWKS